MSAGGEIRSTHAASSQRLYFDDLHLGQRFASGTYYMGEEEMKTFARQYDPQPFHVDSDAAKDSLFKGLAASGWHTAAVTMRLIGESLPLAGGLIGASCEVNWPMPTRPGAILRVESEVIELKPSRSRSDRGIATVRSQTRNQSGDVVQVLISKLVVPRKNPQQPQN